MANTMTFLSLVDEIKADINDVTNRNAFRVANMVIQQINQRVAGIFGVEVAYTAGAAASGYTWSSPTLTLPSGTIKKVLEVYVDEQQFDEIEYSTIKNITTGFYYAYLDKDNIVFGYNVVPTAGGSSEIIYLEVYKEIDEFADTAEATTITIPIQAERVLNDGVMAYLLALPEYKDTDMQALFNGYYERGITELEALALDKKYTY